MIVTDVGYLTLLKEKIKKRLKTNTLLFFILYILALNIWIVYSRV